MMRLLACSLLLILLLGGCATRGSLDFDCEGFAGFTREPTKSRTEQEIHRTTGAALLAGAAPRGLAVSDALAGNAPPRADRRLSDLMVNALQAAWAPGLSEAARRPPGVLLLSGGGQWGAYGAGFLDSQRSAGALPDFPVVSGVSTGAMQALFVGADDKDAYAAMLKRYTPNAESDIVSRNPAALGLITGSFASLKPLRKLLEQEVCANLDADQNCLLTRIAKLRGRRSILIGFVDADSGAFRYVDAVDLANLADKRQARTCIVGAALASAAMPVTFQQVRIDNKTYYDGGVRVSAFESGVALDAEQAVSDATKKGYIAGAEQGATAGMLPLYVVRNGPTTVQPADPKESPDKKADALTAALRAEAIAVNQLEVQSLVSLRTAHPSGALYLVTANKTGCTKPPKSMFDPPFMKCLLETGSRKGSMPDAWTPISELTVPEASRP